MDTVAVLPSGGRPRTFDFGRLSGIRACLPLLVQAALAHPYKPRLCCSVWVQKCCVKKVSGSQRIVQERSEALPYCKTARGHAAGRARALQQIARRLNICEGTVKIHLHNIYDRLASEAAQPLPLWYTE